MSAKEINKVRFKPSKNEGLSKEQVESRIREGLVNKGKIAVGKSIPEIIFTNLFSFFNILLYIIAGFLVFAKAYSSLFFLAVLIPNILIGLIQDLYARHLMRKLRLMTSPVATVIRDGKETTVRTEEIVLDEIVILKAGEQIPADGTVLSGSIAVNESLLTGESENVYKNNGDQVYAGSYVSSGTAVVHMSAVGEETYVSGLQNSANKFKRSPSEILKSLNRMFVIIGTVVIVLGFSLIGVYALRNKLGLDNLNQSIIEIAGSMVSMIPSGLFLLTSVALATGVITLAKKRTAVQELYSIEMLARVDVLCVDKTGTITDGSMKVQYVVGLNDSYSKEQIKQAVSNVLISTKDENPTATALKKYFDYGLTCETIASLPFNSENKYSGATLRGKGTYIIGALDFLNLNNKKGIEYKVNEYASKGYRVLVVGYSSSPINGNKFNGFLDPIALIVLKDNVRPEAIDTFKWFKENNVAIKVISGDDPLTVSEIARDAGIDNADRYISLAGKSVEEVKLLADQYTVFGRVNPEQKEALILALKAKKHCVAMTGDGVNDILALKRADCSIAMASGSSAARNVSHIVLLDSDFSKLPEVVGEGRRVINNIQRTSSLFLVKTTFAMVLTLFFITMSLVNKNYSYPFSTNHMYLWEILAIGMPSFVLALQPNKEIIKGNFLMNILKKALPAGVTASILVIIYFILFVIDGSNAFYFGFAKDFAIAKDQFVTMSVLSFSVFAFISLYRVCSPISFKNNKYRTVTFLSFSAMGILLLVIDALCATVWNIGSILKLNWNSLNQINVVVLIIVTIFISSLYLIINNLFSILGGKTSDKSK